jgi:hypothetical protein
MAMPNAPDKSNNRIKFLLVILGVLLAVYAWYNYLR